MGKVGERTYGVLMVICADTPATKSAAEKMEKMQNFIVRVTKPTRGE